MSKSIAIIRNGRIIYGEEATVPLPTETEARSSREAQRNKYRAEILQPNQVDYYKVHPDKAAGFSDELRRQLS